jgi:hypothetical protein
LTMLVRLLVLGPDIKSKSRNADLKSGWELMLPSCLSVRVNDSSVLILLLSTNAWYAFAVWEDRAISMMISFV